MNERTLIMGQLFLLLIGLVSVRALGGMSSTKKYPTKRKPGYCVTYGTINDRVAITKNYNGPAKEADLETFNLLQDVCPGLARKGLKHTRLCCDKNQLLDLKKKLKTTSVLFSRCPAAVKNYNHMWCRYTCSSNQSTFLDYHYAGYQSNGFQASATYYLTGKYANGLYNSIRNVSYPGTNDKVLGFTCGAPASECTLEKFFAFIGSRQSNPYKINFVFDKKVENITNDNAPMIGCNETYIDDLTGKKVSPCSCQDCEESCAIPPVKSGCNETDIGDVTGKKVSPCSCQECQENCPIPPVKSRCNETYIDDVTGRKVRPCSCQDCQKNCPISRDKSGNKSIHAWSRLLIISLLGLSIGIILNSDYS